VWSDIGSAALRRVAPSRSAAAEAAFHHAFTVLLNNAIDHSGGRWVDVTFEKAGDRVAFETSSDFVAPERDDTGGEGTTVDLRAAPYGPRL